MILIKLLLIIFSFGNFFYEMLTYALILHQRKKPLPDTIKDIYPEKRYQTFLAYKKDYRKIFIFEQVFTLCLQLFCILTPFYTWLQDANPYICLLKTVLVFIAIECVSDLPVSYYSTFTIEEKYGLNHQTKKDFFKDVCIEKITEFLMLSILFAFLIWVATHLEDWTHHFSISFAQAFLIGLLIVAAGFIIMTLLSLFSLAAMRLQYKFTELEDGSLRQQILTFLKESRKKVHHIKVYDESKKSNSKNAFLLKFLGYREFGIADNFLEENSQDELYAVLLHEIGHLKHKKNLWNYTQYAFGIALFLGLVWLISHAPVVLTFNGMINTEFHLSYTNYYLTLSIFLTFCKPFLFLWNFFRNYVSCKEEQEADFNAVDHGYGQALIQTFKKISSDELIDINPHPLIELIEYDHPGMYKRISYIQKRMKKGNVAV
ncbi:MAG: hypothetical protein E7189_07830 [Erysipelotrichaceae bacterium]|nr:hypothetical protein [Erysipelotrichaceae bacterium]